MDSACALVAKERGIALVGLDMSVLRAQRPLNIGPVLFHCTSWEFLLLIAANLISTILECGGGQWLIIRLYMSYCQNRIGLPGEEYRF